MRFGVLDIDPASNPAVLDTASWDPPGAWKVISSLDDAYWQAVQTAVTHGQRAPEGDGFAPQTSSVAHHQGSNYFLASLADGQQVFVELGNCGSASVLGERADTALLESGLRVSMFRTDASVVDRFFRLINPVKGPKPLGTAVPRLGIGTRMTTALWPAIWRAMRQGNFAANAIQNSVRELNLLDSLLAGDPPDVNYAFNFGSIESGYTGSSFEGLWVAGVLDALKHDSASNYGADADHIQVKRGSNGLVRAKRLLDASRYYTLFTLDVSDKLEYGAMWESSAAGAEAYLEVKIQDTDTRRSVLDCHQMPRRVGRRAYRLDAATIGRLVGKYWDALEAVEELSAYITGLKDGQPFDLELSIDEHPAEVATFDSLTTDEEVLFVILEMQRRRIPVSHVAPNFGVEKGVDYRCPDGLQGLAQRAQSQSRICEELGVMVDFHSGDDLSPSTRQVIKQATRGRSQFKISPSLQLLFAEVLEDFHPRLFRRWWDDAVAYARREAEAGSPFAAQCLREFESSNHPMPDVHFGVFHHYSFAFVGRRDDRGQFLYRHEFYDLSPAFYEEYQNRVAEFLCSLAEDLFG
jgi:hypothetical protein